MDKTVLTKLNKMSESKEKKPKLLTIGDLASYTPNHTSEQWLEILNARFQSLPAFDTSGAVFTSDELILERLVSSLVAV